MDVLTLNVSSENNHVMFHLFLDLASLILLLAIKW